MRLGDASAFVPMEEAGSASPAWMRDPHGSHAVF